MAHSNELPIIMHDMPPNEILRAAYQDDLAFAYQWLRDKSGISSDILDVGMRAVSQKRKRLGGFLLGEIFPSALCQHFSIPAERRSRLFAAWLSMYSFIELADRSIDTKEPLCPQGMLAASNLLAFGIAELSSYCTSDAQRQMLIRNINHAFDGELQDHAAQTGATDHDRSSSDANKNRALVVATIGFCLAANRRPDKYVGFVEQLLPVFQFLDDIQDVKEDLEQGNLTSVVKALLSKCSNAPPNLDDRYVYFQLALSPKFGDMLGTVTDVLEHSLLLLDLSSDTILIQYFSSLLTHMRSLHALCTEVNTGSRAVDPDEVVQKVIRVAAST